jgi:hypothetical protein
MTNHALRVAPAMEAGVWDHARAIEEGVGLSARFKQTDPQPRLAHRVQYRP